MLHISCNIGTRDLPDVYALSPQALGRLRAYISGKSQVPMLQLLHSHVKLVIYTHCQIIFTRACKALSIIAVTCLTQK